MKRRVLIILAAIVIVATGSILLFRYARNSTNPAEPPSGDTIKPTLRYGIDVTHYLVIDTVIPEGSIFGGLMAAYGVPGHVIHQMVALSDTVFDLRKLRAGNACVMIREPQGDQPLRWFIYHPDVVNYIVFDFGDSLQIRKGALDVDTVPQRYSGVISSSLWNDMVADAQDPNLVLALSDVFAWEIDFYGIQQGDKFKVMYDELRIEGRRIGFGTIHATWFRHAGTDFYGFRYMQDDVMEYFDEEGNSLRREFLKAPLEFRRISSHFSHSRLHPILRRYRPHHGVDYAAAPGTPVRTIGDGTVIQAGYSGGAGRMVKVRHNSVYTTVYMHLRGFGKGIRAGSRVTQGEVIGYVGSSGLSTGPHLDFRVYKNGTPVNPLKLESPPSKPIHPERLEQYKKDIKALKIRIDKLR